MRWRVKKGGKLYSRGYEKVVGSELAFDLDGVTAGGVMEGANVVSDGVMEGGYEVDIVVIVVRFDWRE